MIASILRYSLVRIYILVVMPLFRSMTLLPRVGSSARDVESPAVYTTIWIGMDHGTDMSIDIVDYLSKAEARIRIDDLR